jgi:hypothetical protein
LSRYISVIITGNNRTIAGDVHVYVECEATGQKRDVFSGGVGGNVNESILTVPTGWCPSNARLMLKSTEQNTMVGVGSVYEISWFSWFKSSFLGKLPYLLVALFVFSLIMFSGASFYRRLSDHDDSLLTAFIILGLGCLAAFYLTNVLPIEYRWGGGMSVVIVSIGGILLAGHDAPGQSHEEIGPKDLTSLGSA